jgi:putative aldouronate transport system permease protein
MTSAVPRWAGARPSSNDRSKARDGRLRSINGVAPPSYPVRGFKGLLLTLCCVAVILPFVAVISTSLADQNQVNAAGGYVLWPTKPSLDAYQVIFAGGVVSRALIVSVVITVAGSFLAIVCQSTLAYALSRPGSFAHKPILLAVLFTLLFSPGMIPSYLMIKELGLLDSYWSLILPGLANGFQIIVMRAFFLEIPEEIIESARIDGANDLQIFLRIVLPLSKAAIAVIGLFNAVAYWNAFFNALLYISDNAKWPLQLVLRTYVIDSSTIGPTAPGEILPPQESLQMAILVVSLLPIVLIYPLLQRHFAKGVMIGAVKG